MRKIKLPGLSIIDEFHTYKTYNMVCYPTIVQAEKYFSKVKCSIVVPVTLSQTQCICIIILITTRGCKNGFLNGTFKTHIANKSKKSVFQS